MKIGDKGVALWMVGTLLASGLFWIVRIAEGRYGPWTAVAFACVIFVSTALFTRSQRKP